MDTRLNLFENPVVAKALKHFGSASAILIGDSNLSTTIQNLVMLRASQINGCGFCTDMRRGAGAVVLQGRTKMSGRVTSQLE